MTTNNTTPRYPSTYRQDEIRLICDCARQGQSMCFVGIAGTGKTNIVNFLHSDPYHYKSHYLGEETDRIHFPVVYANTWDQTPLGLWQMMLSALQAVQQLPQSSHGEKITRLVDKELRMFDSLQAQVTWVCQELGHQLMFILDDFDGVIQRGPRAMLDQLNSLRIAGNQDRLSYLVFTKRLPHILGRAHNLEHESKFYDLVRNHIYALGMYTAEDGRQMLQHLNDVADKPLQNGALAQIHQLGGGHARLLKVVFDAWREQTPPPNDLARYFVRHTNVQQECHRILHGLHSDEQAVALRLAQGRTTPSDDDMIEYLVRRGLLTRNNPPEWFSPLMAEFLAQEN